VLKLLKDLISRGSFIFVIALGMFSANWQNDIKTEEYLYHQKYLHSYGHPTGTTDIKKMNEKNK